jgi:hypothetical protein
MRMFRIRMAVALACCGLAVGGCASVESRVCERADECNALPTGTSEAECAERTTQCTDDLTSADRADWEKVTSDCLELQSCSNFVSCYLKVPNC